MALDRGAILPGQYFATNGAVFRRSQGGEEFDFAGKVGRCIRVSRQRLDGSFLANGDAEWMRVAGGRVRGFYDWREAAGYLEARAIRQEAED